MGYGPYKIFDKNNPEHPDYKADEDDDDDIQLSLPIDYVSAPQDGKIPTRLFYNRPYKNPEMFIKDKQMIEDAKERFKGLTGIDLAHNRTDHDHTPDFQLPDGRDYYQSPNHEMMIPVDPSGNPIPELMNENMMISGGAFLKSVGGGNMITRDEYEAGLEQVRQIDNPLERRLAEDRLVNQYYLGIDPV